MATPLHLKSSPDEIGRRFDKDVERFSNLETGQAAVVDATLMMELIADAAVATTPTVRHVLDIGCGAGNNALKLLEKVGSFACDLVDLSEPMLAKAKQRLSAAGADPVRIHHDDFRDVQLPANTYHVVIAAAVLHHLRDDADWETAFRKIFDVTAPGGSIWISDMVSHESPSIHAVMWERYGTYLERLDGEAYRDRVFAYIDREDSPRPLSYQLDLLRRVGFSEVDVLHKNGCFAAFGAVKPQNNEAGGAD